LTTPYLIGIDSGSSQCKGVLLTTENNQAAEDGLPGNNEPWSGSGFTVVTAKQVASGYQPEKTAQSIIEALLAKAGTEGNCCTIVATGYGRERIEQAARTVTEITAHGRGASFLKPSTDAVIDIGGQDCKVIKLEKGRVRSFEMNDKCAAGTGRFLEMACRSLDMGIATMDQHAQGGTPAPINSMCAVFAESELIGLLNSGRSREDILCGVLHSIALRIAHMAHRAGVTSSNHFLFTGGLSRSKVLLAALQETLEFPHIETHHLAPFAGAIGAALAYEA
jgi:predicted CoA-substrate-specific enzyme activase